MLVIYFLLPLLLELVCHLGKVDTGLGTADWLLDLHLEICLSFFGIFNVVYMSLETKTTSCLFGFSGGVL